MDTSGKNHAVSPLYYEKPVLITCLAERVEIAEDLGRGRAADPITPGAIDALCKLGIEDGAREDRRRDHWVEEATRDSSDCLCVKPHVIP
jgi:hypothetical protein